MGQKARAAVNGTPFTIAVHLKGSSHGRDGHTCRGLRPFPQRDFVKLLFPSRGRPVRGSNIEPLQSTSRVPPQIRNLCNRRWQECPT